MMAISMFGTQNQIRILHAISDVGASDSLIWLPRDYGLRFETQHNLVVKERGIKLLRNFYLSTVCELKFKRRVMSPIC